MSGEARLEILSRIYKAGVKPPGQAVPTPPAGLPRPRVQVVEQFAEYAAEYRAQVRGCTEAELRSTIAALLAGERAILPPGLPPEWTEGASHASDSGQSHRELSSFGAVVTGCAVAIAETGTVVLDHGAGQGRRALTLIPDHHICVVYESQVVDSMPQGVAALGAGVRAGRPLTFISGPSATSDIELSRVEGVHGPRRLDIVLVSADVSSGLG
ncbi:lactate utilization protein C [Deinococcus altitudinis]|uniref:LutC/YkgG family protein n=1 Tax=Deinococcus altitudinis TaxID=468914 RepID=UPI00389271E8